MRYLWILLFCLVIGAAITGCGGGGSSSSSSGGGSQNGSSPFAGRFVGTFKNSGGDGGELYLKVSSTGAVTGAYVNATESTTSTVTGTIAGTGTAVLTTSGGTSTGTLTLSASNQLTGTVTDSAAGTSVTMALSPASGGSNPTYAGDLSGTFSNSNGDSGNLTMIVDANGNVTGLVDDTAKDQAQLLSGTINSAGSVDISAAGDSGATTGTLTLSSSGKVTGTLNGTGGTSITVALQLS